MPTRTVSINRAPVMTLWASVVAERVGFDRPEALSLGRAVAGLNAQSKGRKVGVFRPHEEEPEAARKRGEGDEFLVELCGRAVPAVVTPRACGLSAGGRRSARAASRSTWPPSSATHSRPCGGS